MKELKKDRFDNGGWENNSIEDFLEASCGWGWAPINGLRMEVIL